MFRQLKGQIKQLREKLIKQGQQTSAQLSEHILQSKNTPRKLQSATSDKNLDWKEMIKNAEMKNFLFENVTTLPLSEMTGFFMTNWF